MKNFWSLQCTICQPLTASLLFEKCVVGAYGIEDKECIVVPLAARYILCIKEGVVYVEVIKTFGEFKESKSAIQMISKMRGKYGLKTSKLSD